MSTPKKVSQLPLITPDGTELVYVSKAGTDNAVSINSVATFVNAQGSGNLIWDLATFQTNANTILPAGKRAYYKKGNGRITGIYKISDGVNTIANLPLMYDNWNTGEYPANNFFDVINNFKVDFINNRLSVISDAPITNAAVGANWRQYCIVVPFPIKLLGYSINVLTFTTAGVQRAAMYYINADETGSYVNNSYGEINVTGTGFNSVTLATQPTLEPGMYHIVMYQASGSFTQEIYSASGGTYPNASFIFDRYGNKKNYLVNSNVLTNPPPSTSPALNSYDKISQYIFYINFQKLI